MFEEFSKRELLAIMVTLLAGCASVAGITVYIAEKFVIAQHADHPLSRAGGLESS